MADLSVSFNPSWVATNSDAASGISETVSSPTMYMAGERGRERVNITPMNIQPPAVNIAPQPIHNHFHVGTKEIFSELTYASKYGQLKLHSRASKRF